MFLKTIRSEGLAHLSYILGDGTEAAVVDPRRDVDVYVEIAAQQGMRITKIFETHRHEDFVVGSRELANRTDARVLHGAGLDFGYGETVGEGAEVEIGKLLLRVLETPGHTDESISVAVYDRNFSEESAIGVFTGDALFVGEVGRTDFYPARAREVAGKLYDSIHEKLLPLGDQVILYPAHGAGSVCGAGTADREFSTLGYERKHNPRLQLDRETFIRFKRDEHHYKPPYFKAMEDANVGGSEVLGRLAMSVPCDAERFARAMDEGMLAVDVRDPEAVCGAHIPGSLAVPLDMLASFAGWFLPYDRPLGLIVGSIEDAKTAVRILARMDYTKVRVHLDEGMHGWEITGREYRTIPAVHALDVKKRIERKKDFVLLDVRGKGEVESKRLVDSTHVYVGEVEQYLDRIPRDRTIVTFCGSGQRAVIAASVLLRNGFKDVEVSLGSMAACTAVGCPTES